MTLFHWTANGLLIVVLAAIAWQDWCVLRLGRQKRAIGTVIDHRRSVDDGAEYFAARVRFVSDTGREFVFEDSVGRAKPPPAVGSVVDVIYPIADPSRARVPRPGLRLFIYAALILALALVTASGLRWIG